MENTEDLHDILINFLKSEKQRWEKTGEPKLIPMQLSAIDGAINGWYDIAKTKSIIEENKICVIRGDDIIDSDIEEKPFIIDKLIPERAITAITADSGKGKSLLALVIAKAVAKGEKLFGEFEVKQSKVIIVDLEMDKDLIQGRYKAVIKEKGLPIDYIYEQPISIDNEKDFMQLIELAKNYKVIIFDTLTNLHNKNENSSDEMKIVNKLMLKLINETGITIIYLHHHRKRQQGEFYSQSSSRGSTEIIAKVASHLLIDSKQSMDEECGVSTLELTITQEKARRPERINKIGVKIHYDMNLKETHWEYMGEIDDREVKIEQAKEFILTAVEQGWLSINEMKVRSEEQGKKIGESNLREGCRELVKAGLLKEEKGKKLGKEQKSAKYYGFGTC